MATPDYQGKCTDNSDIATILSSEGVEFLLSSEGKVPLSSCYGKKLCLYFSANWCRPCKAFTPQLIQLYNSLRNGGKELEIILVSFDRDDNKFEEHFKCLPWLAVPFDSNLHRRLSDKFHVDRIPSLIPLSSDGISIEEDLIGLIEDYGAEAFPFTRKRREELKAIDKAKREGGKLEQLLAHEERNYLISRDGRQTPVSKLVGKTIGLYFGARWSPPCRSFTAKLTETYDAVMSSSAASSTFEIVFVSTDRDLGEFEVNLGLMPWLAVPYQDRATRQDLCRIFDVKEIPGLVLMGPEGRPVAANGKAVITSYGAKAFPFTESRIGELEAALREEGEALPARVKDRKHEHVLKLDMAGGYVCDWCKQQGRFWAFSCDVCDYDLHPTCLEIPDN
ncbi:Thioredoxin-like fold containing protein [Parasponia andersonii]|uniref:protein-disulfide reductase n=1 Tax=Parasponia andersonii TaxID=3476 RepID=A0A2P5DT32_PARAD|nr:Thioredoxin-like fold containing protein [Parasponia andersonii]